MTQPFGYSPYCSRTADEEQETKIRGRLLRRVELGPALTNFAGLVDVNSTNGEGEINPVNNP